MLVHHGGFGVVAHAAGAGLMLAAAEPGLRLLPPRGLDGAGFLEPQLGLVRGELAELDIVRMIDAREPGHGDAPESLTFGSACTRESNTGISCEGPMMTMLRRNQVRM